MTNRDKIPKVPINRPRVYKKENPNSQTKRKMAKEMESFVLNQEIPDTPSIHRAVWLAARPGETLTQDDIIHHINGNHNDNRPENLEKLTDNSTHRLKHMVLDEKDQMEARGQKEITP